MNPTLVKGFAVGIVLALALIGLSFWSLEKTSSNPGTTPFLVDVCFGNGRCIKAEVADSAQERETGLMNRETLPQDRGMVFVFDEASSHPFWMKNTKIALDLIWVAGDGRVSGIYQNATPCTSEPCPTYGENFISRFVVETNAGFVAENEIRPNQKVSIAGFAD